MLKRFYAKKDEVPEALSAFYVEQDGGYVLQAEGHVDKGQASMRCAPRTFRCARKSRN